MTIEFGVLSNHGALLCADSEETAEIRRSANKLEVYFDQRQRAVIVGGAGPSDHLDAVAELLKRDVFEASGQNIHKDLEAKLKKTIREYYRDHILCWPTEIERNDNDFAVLLATKLPLSSPALWVSHQTALRRVTSFTAIGTGAAYAKSLLDAYFNPMHDPALISLMAIYILQRVKRDIPYCGRESRLHWLTHGGELCHVSAETIAQAETLFQRYERSVAAQFFFIAGDSNDKDSSQVLSQIKKLCGEFAELKARIQKELANNFPLKSMQAAFHKKTQKAEKRVNK